MAEEGLPKIDEKKPWQVLEFYSGIGGMRYSLMASEVVAEVVEVFEINDSANDVYQHNFKHRPYQGAPAENEVADQPHSNRFNSVIEKIERLYMGKDSSDGEELDGAPDDDEYDTEDSFIDDAELDEYFEVDNSQIKHDGFFVNRGKLERLFWTRRRFCHRLYRSILQSCYF